MQATAPMTNTSSPTSMESPYHDEDVAVMLALAKGDESSFATLVNRWKGPLINFFYKSIRSFELAEELTQTVFVRLYKAAPRYQPTAKFSTYLFQIARRLLINEYRKAQRKPLDFVDPSQMSASSPVDPTGRQKLNMMEFEEAIEIAMQALPENHRTAILLLKQQGLSYDEIAQTMDATESSVKTWIFRARKQLKELLKDFA